MCSDRLWPGVTNRFPTGRQDHSLFERTAAGLGVRHKLIRPYAPRHNGKVERSHRESQKRFYSCHSFYSLGDVAKQLAVYDRPSSNFPMRPSIGFPTESLPPNMGDKSTAQKWKAYAPGLDKLL